MKNFLFLVKMDLYRFRGKCNFLEFIYLFFFEFGFRIIFYYRFSQVKMFSFFARVLLKRSARFGVTISPKAVIGGGFYMGHAHNICISQYAKIGVNVNVSQGVTIGSNSKVSAVVGDFVYIGPNSVIVDDVFIASHVIVGAGSIVVRSCETPGGIYVGNPSKFLKINNKYNYHPFCIKS